MKIVVVHEVSYLEKIIYEYQILPEMLSMLGHELIGGDYQETWQSDSSARRVDLRTKVYPNTHRAYPAPSVTGRRPGMVPILVHARISAVVTKGFEVHK